MVRFEYPPKPTLITKDQPLFQSLSNDPKVVAELKYNGTRLVLIRNLDGSYVFYGRDRQILKYSPSKEIIEMLNSLNWKGECVLDGELLHFKTKHIKNTIVLFDVFYWDGRSLKNEVFSKRRQVLLDLFPESKVDPFHFPVYPAAHFVDNFKSIFESHIIRDEIEGLVMKRLDARLEFGKSSSPTVKYMWKVRRPGPTYRW